MAACTSAADAPEEDTPATTDSVSVVTTAPVTTTSSVPPGPGRLVITDERGRVVVLNPDGSNREALTAADGLAYFQPTWSPDGRLIAAGHDTGTETGLAIIDTVDGGIGLAPSFSMPFYVFWSPDGSKVAFLNNGSTGRLDMTLHDVAANTTELFEVGSPFYFSWAPDGTSLATHVGIDTMDVRSLAGDIEPLAPPGAFQAPQWTEGGLFHVGVQGDIQHLLLTDGDTRSLGEVRGSAMFTATADGSRIALSSFSEQDGVTVAARPWQPSQPEQVLPSNRLIVLEVASGEWQTVSAGPVAAFFWSPDGSRLLTLGSGGQGLPVEWSVWEGESTSYGAFLPSPSFVQNLLPFFDQYAQSFTLWSPDGRSFAYPAVTGGADGIWIQEVAGGDPIRVADGSWVAWSNG